MTKALMVAACIGMAALVGCKKSEEGGRAGNDTFRLSVSALSTNINQGETQIVPLTVERGEAFQQPIRLETEAPAGLQVEIKNALVKPGDKGEVQLLITAAKDAPLGEQKILVKGTPDKGDAAEIEFRVAVRAGGGTAGGTASASTSTGGTFQIELPLAVPLLAEPIKQGETKVVTISLKRSDDFKQDVKLEMKGSTKGISLDLAQTTVKASDKPEVLLRVTADKDAALGDYQVYIKGTPETGEQVSADFKVKVVAP